MNESQRYYDDFGSGYWAKADPKECRCRGSGWALSEVDTWHQCPEHYKGQAHPEDGVYDDDLESLEYKPAPAPYVPLTDGDIPF